jgi:hypothetical protein
MANAAVYRRDLVRTAFRGRLPDPCAAETLSARTRFKLAMAALSLGLPHCARIIDGARLSDEPWARGYMLKLRRRLPGDAMSRILECSRARALIDAALVECAAVRGPSAAARPERKVAVATRRRQKAAERAALVAATPDARVRSLETALDEIEERSRQLCAAEWRSLVRLADLDGSSLPPDLRLLHSELLAKVRSLGMGIHCAR